MRSRPNVRARLAFLPASVKAQAQSYADEILKHKTAAKTMLNNHPKMQSETQQVGVMYPCDQCHEVPPQ